MRSEAFMAASRLGEPDRLDVDELADTVLRQLASIARPLDPTEGQARVRLHDAVDKYGAGLDLRRQMLGAPPVLGPEGRAEATGRCTAQASRSVLLLRA